MIKRIFTIFVVLALCLSLYGCGKPGLGVDNKWYINESLFVLVEQYADCIVYRHKDTNVLYVYAYSGSGSGSGFSVLLEPDGTPQIWKEY